MTSRRPNLLYRGMLTASGAVGIAVFAVLHHYGAGSAAAAGWAIGLSGGLAALTWVMYRRVCEPLITTLQESEVQYRTILETTVDAIVTIEENGTVHSVNAAAERLFGYGAEEMVGQNVSMLMPEPDRSRHDNYLKRYIETGERHIIGIGREVMARCKDGSRLPVDLAVSQFGLGGRRMFTGVLRDISERKRLEEQLTRSSKLASLGELVGGIAHEVNTPTGIIVMRSSGLIRAEAGLSADAREDIEVIQRQAHKIAQITSGLLAFSRQAPFDPRPVSPNTVIEKSLGLIENMMRSRGITLERNLDADVPLVLMDASRIEQVLLNLFNNAMDAMPDGGDLHVSTGVIDGRWARVSVRDTGTGIEPRHIDRLFDPFFTTKEVGKGTGLGLSISYGLVEEHDGRLEVESTEGVGSTFHILLPAHEPDSRSIEP